MRGEQNPKGHQTTNPFIWRPTMHRLMMQSLGVAHDHHCPNEQSRLFPKSLLRLDRRADNPVVSSAQLVPCARRLVRRLQ